MVCDLYPPTTLLICHVYSQYNAVSAWVPASFAVPKLLPGLPAWMNMKKKKQTHAEPSDGEKPAFRQVGVARFSHRCRQRLSRPQLTACQPAPSQIPCHPVSCERGDCRYGGNACLPAEPPDK